MCVCDMVRPGAGSINAGRVQVKDRCCGDGMDAARSRAASASTEVSDEHDVVDLVAARDGELAAVARDGVVAYEVGGEVGQLFRVVAVRVYPPEVQVAAALRLKDDVAPVGRSGGGVFPVSVVGQLVAAS